MAEVLRTAVFDENRTVTYKWLSRKLDIHTNEAKKILYNFYENNKGDQTLCPTYLVSGEKDGVRSFVIVPLDKLDEIKQTFTLLHGIHLYSISLAIPKDSSILWSTDFEFLRKQEYNPQKFSHITYDGVTILPRLQKRTTNEGMTIASKENRTPNITGTESSSPVISRQSSKEDKETDSPKPLSISKETPPHLKKKQPSKTGGRLTSNNTLASMFARQNSDPKPVLQKNPSSSPEKKAEKRSQGLPFGDDSDDDFEVSPKKKRKVIFDTSSSEDEEEPPPQEESQDMDIRENVSDFIQLKKQSSDERPTITRSPHDSSDEEKDQKDKKNEREDMEAEKEEEEEESQEKKKEIKKDEVKLPFSEEESGGTVRKKVIKKKTYMNDQGYLVTENVEEWEEVQAPENSKPLSHSKFFIAPIESINKKAQENQEKEKKEKEKKEQEKKEQEKKEKESKMEVDEDEDEEKEGKEGKGGKKKTKKEKKSPQSKPTKEKKGKAQKEDSTKPSQKTLTSFFQKKD